MAYGIGPSATNRPNEANTRKTIPTVLNSDPSADESGSWDPMLRKLRAEAPVHAGWPEMGMVGNSGDGPPTFTAYTFDTVKAIFTDNVTFHGETSVWNEF